MARGHGHATSSLKKLDHVEYIWLEGMNPTEASALKIKSIFSGVIGSPATVADRPVVVCLPWYSNPCRWSGLTVRSS